MMVIYEMLSLLLYLHDYEWDSEVQLFPFLCSVQIMFGIVLLTKMF